jgi:hypothetical protein
MAFPSWQEYNAVEEKMLGCPLPGQDRLPQKSERVWGQKGAPPNPSEACHVTARAWRVVT